MNALEKYELEELAENEIKEKEAWRISDLSGADWALRKISALKKKNAENKAFADHERERLAKWEEQENASNLDTINYFEMKLGEYLLQLRNDDPKAKVKTPHGTVSTRKKPDSWEYSETAIEELKQSGLSEFINTKITETVKKADFKKAIQVTENGDVVTQDGEILKSVKVVPQGFDIVVKEAN